MGDFQSINMYEMAMMLADDGGDRSRKRMWRSDYITDQFHSTVSSLKLGSYCADQEIPCFC